MNGLIVAEPWISMILVGRKCWEMRSRHTLKRGRIALIRKGSGHVVGLARVVDSLGPLDLSELDLAQPKHCIPIDLFASGDGSEWSFAWVLEDVRGLSNPVPYDHPKGAVTWVRLCGEVVAEVQSQFGAGDQGSDCGAEASEMDARLLATTSATTTRRSGPSQVYPGPPPEPRTPAPSLADTAEHYLEATLERTSTPSKYVAGFRTKRGREVALERERTGSICLWAETVDPSARFAYVLYAPDKSRNSNLNRKHAPRLSVGHAAVYLTLRGAGDLKEFVDWYVRQ